MSKFKKGDKVRIISNVANARYLSKHVGKECNIIQDSHYTNWDGFECFYVDIPISKEDEIEIGTTDQFFSFCEINLELLD